MTMRKKVFRSLARAFLMAQMTTRMTVDPPQGVLLVKARGIDVMVKATALITPVMGPQRRAAAVTVAVRQLLTEL